MSANGQLSAGPDRLIVIAVCTRRRPQMLSACLESLLCQSAPVGWRWQLLVVENDAEPRIAEIVDSKRREASVPLDYRLEPTAGIPFARNAAVEAALALGADRIAFVDDDEMVAEDWLREVIAAADTHQADVVEGPVYFDTSAGSDFWIDEVKYSFDEGTVRDRASTANVAFAARLVAPPPDGLGLRFNERLRFTGGSDTEFFLRANDAGARIVWSARPKVIERLSAGRLTFRWQFRRAFRIAANEAQYLLEAQGLVASAKQLGGPSLHRLSNGLLGLAVAPLRLRQGKERFRAKALKSGRKLAWGMGSLVGLTPLRPRPYARVDGE